MRLRKKLQHSPLFSLLPNRQSPLRSLDRRALLTGICFALTGLASERTWLGVRKRSRSLYPDNRSNDAAAAIAPAGNGCARPRYRLLCVRGGSDHLAWGLPTSRRSSAGDAGASGGLCRSVRPGRGFGLLRLRDQSYDDQRSRPPVHRSIDLDGYG
jgi:hypothetical protein